MDVVKSKKTRRRTGSAEDWVYEAEMKETAEDVGAIAPLCRMRSLHLRIQADLKGLGALLLDDSMWRLNLNFHLTIDTYSSFRRARSEGR